MEKLAQKIANILPRRVLYFAVIKAWAIATTGKYSDRTPDSLTWSDVLGVLYVAKSGEIKRVVPAMPINTA